MKKQIGLRCALALLTLAWGCGGDSKGTDAARPVDTAVDSSGKPKDGAVDTARLGDSAGPGDTGVGEVRTGDTAISDAGLGDAPLSDAAPVDAPAGDLLSSDGGEGDAPPVDASTCTPSAQIVRFSQTDITLPITWTSGKVYVVEEPIVLSAVLTIEPGVVVKFLKGPAISMNEGGAIVADGKSPDTAIVFTSIKDDAHGGDSNNDCNATAPAPGDWAGIKVSQPGSIFNHAQFFYGGSQKPYSGVLSASADAVTSISNCTFAFNDGGTPEDARAGALNLRNAGVVTKLTGNTFYGNAIPLVVNPGMSVDNSNRFSSQPASAEAGTAILNKHNGIFTDGVIDGTATWSNVTVPFVIYKQVLTVSDNASLTLSDGVVVKLWKGRVDVRNLGTLTPASSVAFTSFNDDGRLGDTNGDGAASAPAAGDWSGVNLCKPLCKYATWGNIFYAEKN